MWLLEPLAFAGRLLSALGGQLGSLWDSLLPLCLWLRATLGLAGSDRAQRQPGGKGPEGARREAEGAGGDQPLTPTSVNYHFTRQCNYKCGFCFHTAKTSFVLPLEEAKRGLRLLQEAGERRRGARGVRARGSGGGSGRPRTGRGRRLSMGRGVGASAHGAGVQAEPRGGGGAG